MTGLGDKIRVERLDTARLARIEAGVIAARELPGEGMRGRPAWLRFAPLAAAACALVLVAGALGYWLRGGAGAVAAGSPPVPAITTGPGESATVAIGDAVVTVSPSTQVSVRSRPDGRIDLDLQRGKVDCDVTPRPGRPLFAVHAADVDVAVVGTRFSVQRDGDEVKVDVQRGKVSVTRAGRQVYVAAGENWPAGTRVAQVEPEVPAPGSGSGSAPGSGSESGSGSGSAPGSGSGSGSGSGRPQKSGHRDQQGTAETAGKGGVNLPAGLPPKHECATADACWDIVRNNYRDGAAAALYTLIRLDIDENKLDLAGKHAELYLRRFPRGAHAAAVKQLKRIAGGE